MRNDLLTAMRHCVFVFAGEHPETEKRWQNHRFAVALFGAKLWGAFSHLTAGLAVGLFDDKKTRFRETLVQLRGELVIGYEGSESYQDQCKKALILLTELLGEGRRRG